MVYNCYYGIGTLEPSTIEAFDHEEGPRIIHHVNHPLKVLKEDKSRWCIWLKTYGLKAFLIECSFADLDSTISALKLEYLPRFSRGLLWIFSDPTDYSPSLVL